MFQPREALVWLSSMLTAVHWPGWSTVALYLHPKVYRSSTVAGIVMLAIDAGAGLGLPNSTALPTLALALEMGLEAALLNKFMASAELQRGKKKQQLAVGTICSGIR